MRRSLVIATLAMLGSVTLAHAGDEEDVMAVVNKYMEYEESGQMIEQGKLMTDDRAMMYVGGRLTGDNRKVMQEQQEYQDRYAKEFPGVRYEIEIRDVIVQTYNGDSALVTLEWFPTRVVPPTLPPEKVKQLGPAKIPLIAALVLVKQQDAWKIAFTTFVPREKPKPT